MTPPVTDATGLVAVSARLGFDMQIVVMNLDGSVFGAVSTDGNGQGYPAWSPDGRLVAYEATPNGSARQEIYVADADGSGTVQLTAVPGRASFQAQWADGGNQIVFVRSDRAYASTPQELWIMNADGSDQRMLNDGDSRGPVVSPDGTTVAFLFEGETHLMSIAGGDPVRLTDLDAFPVSWSPDGTAIVVEAGRDALAGGPFDQASDLWLVPIDGSSPIRLTDAPGRDHNARWSPDGAWLVFTSTRDGSEDLFVMRSNGSEQTRLTTSDGVDGQGRWLEDGRIVFISERDGEFALFVVNRDGSGLGRAWPADDSATVVWFNGLEVTAAG
jgi:TolB protein